MTSAQINAEIEKLRDENQTLRDRIEELESVLFAGVRDGVRIYGCNVIQSRLLAFIASRGMVTRDAIMTALYGCDANDPPDIKIIDTYVHHVRKKVAKASIVIETVWGQGFRMSSEHRAAVKAEIAKAMEAQT